MQQYTDIPLKYDLQSFQRKAKETLYFHVPNYTSDRVEIDVKALESNRIDRSKKREARRLEQDEMEERAAFEAMSFEQYKEEKDKVLAELLEVTTAKAALEERAKQDRKEFQEQLKQAKKRARYHTNKSEEEGDGAAPFVTPAKRRVDELDIEESHLFYLIEALWKEYGGLNRFNIFCNDWHEAHPEAAKRLFGFETWAEAKHYIQALFPDIDVTEVSRMDKATLLKHEKNLDRTAKASSSKSKHYSRKLHLSKFEP